MIGIIDLGLGNLLSVSRAFDKIGKNNKIINNPTDKTDFSLIVLPGVGSYNYAIQILKQKKFDKWLLQKAREKKNILGICLGMQLLCNSSIEKKKTNGLKFFKQDVIKLKKIKTPNVGWFNILTKKKNLFNIKSKSRFYFTHSFMYSKIDKSCIGYIMNDGQKIPAIIKEKNIIGLQFHPEKSREHGLLLLKNIVEKEFKIKNDN